MDLPNIIELCAGYGGIGLGLTLALGEVQPLCYVEREVSVARKLVARFQDGSLAPADIWSDVKTFDGRPYRGKTDILCAGYPCQPFSCAGKQLAEKDPRHLWPHVARIIREIQPRQVFLENVDAHLRLGFHQVARELSGMGYRIAAGLFSAEEVGAPHRRLRLFALAERTERGRGELWESSRRNGFADGRGAELAHADGRGHKDGRTTIPGTLRHASDAYSRSAIEGPGSGMADTAKPGRRPLAQECPSAYRTRPSYRPAGAGAAVFPPGPADLEAWTRLLMQSPDVEPALCRASDGSANRVDRLRALGNGVVPIVAAHAYRTLAAAHASN